MDEQQQPQDSIALAPAELPYDDQELGYEAAMPALQDGFAARFEL